MQDPFYVVKEEVAESLKVSTALFERWRELMNGDGTQEELDWTTGELNKNLRSIDWDLQDLEETVNIVEKNRAKFSIDEPELNSRRQFIKDTRWKMQNIRDTLNNTQNRAKAQKKAREKLMPTIGSKGKDKYTKLDEYIVHDNNDFINGQYQDQEMIMRNQDKQLDQVAISVARVGDVARTINMELGTQNAMLQEVDQEIDNTTNFLKNTQKRLNAVMQASSKDKKLIATIVVLIIILAVLIVLVIGL